jgi:hypothetical protein
MNNAHSIESPIISLIPFFETCILKSNEDPGLLMRSKCSRTCVRSALFAFIKARLFICIEYILDKKAQLKNETLKKEIP